MRMLPASIQQQMESCSLQNMITTVPRQVSAWAGWFLCRSVSYSCSQARRPVVSERLTSPLQLIHTSRGELLVSQCPVSPLITSAELRRAHPRQTRLGIHRRDEQAREGEPCTTAAGARVFSRTLNMACYGNIQMQGLKWCPRLITVYRALEHGAPLWWFENAPPPPPIGSHI